MAAQYVNLTPYDAQLAAIQRQQKYAELLSQQGAEPIDVQSVNGIPTPISPFQGLAKVFQQGMGGYLEGQATKDQAALDTVQSQKYADALSQMYDPRVDTSNKNDVAITGRFDPATGKPGANVGMVDTSGIYNRDPTSAEQSQAARGLIGTKYADVVPGMLSEVQKTAAAERERQRTLDQEKSLTKPANVSDAAWNSAANVPGMRTDLFKSNSVTKHGDFAQELIDSGMVPGTVAFNRAMADKRRKETYIAPVTPAGGTSIATYTITGPDGKPTTKLMTPAQALALQTQGYTVDSRPLSQKSIPSKLAEDLKIHAGGYDTAVALSRDFKPEYTNQGVLGVGGDTAIAAKKIYDKNDPAVSWWTTYQEKAGQIRNKMYGASLTPNELAEWQKIAVNPNMNSETIVANLERQRQIEERALARDVNGLSKSGYSSESVEGYTGYPVTQFAHTFDKPLQAVVPTSVAPATPASLVGKSLQYNPKTKQFRDKSTKTLYNIDGSPA